MSKENSFSPTRHHFPDAAIKYIEDLSRELSWFYSRDCAYGDAAIDMGLDLHPYFSHTFLEYNNIGPYFHKMPWDQIGKFIGLPNNKMIRAHITLQYPRPEVKDVPHNIHVDQQFPHIVALYYPNDSDGDTFFYANPKAYMGLMGQGDFTKANERGQGAPIVSNQVAFSIIDSRPLQKMIPECKKRNVKLLCYATLMGGFLSKRWL